MSLILISEDVPGPNFPGAAAASSPSAQEEQLPRQGVYSRQGGHSWANAALSPSAKVDYFLMSRGVSNIYMYI